jgi:prepilin-type processing-associated H-X9-DG protein
MEVLADETEFLKVVELYRHGTLLGSNYLYLDLHVDSAAPKQALEAIDPWDVPTPPPPTN